MTERSPDGRMVWKYSNEDLKLIEELEKSGDKLHRTYAKAYKAGCFVTEFANAAGHYTKAAVGELDAVAQYEADRGSDVEFTRFTEDECKQLGAQWGEGTSRAERVANALQKVLAARHGNESTKVA